MPSCPTVPWMGSGAGREGAWLSGPWSEEGLARLLLPRAQVGGGARLAEGPWATFCHHRRPGIWLWEQRLTLHC